MSRIEGIIQYKLWKYHNLGEVLPNIHMSKWGGSEVDALYITKSGYSIFYEIKASIGDFRKDFEKPRHIKLLSRDHRLMVKPKKFIYICYNFLPALDEIPEYAGCIFCTENYHLKFEEPYKEAPVLWNEKISETAKEFIYKKISSRYQYMYYKNIREMQK